MEKQKDANRSKEAAHKTAAQKDSAESGVIVEEVRLDEVLDMDFVELDGEMAMQATVERNKSTLAGRISVAFALGMAIFHIYTGVFGLFDAITQRGVHLAFAITILVLQMPLIDKLLKGKLKGMKAAKPFLYSIDIFMIIGTWAAVFISRYEYMMRAQRAGGVSVWASVAGCVLLLVILECSRRALGIIMPCLAIVFIAYALAGPYMPYVLAHKGYSLMRIFSFLSTNTDGIFGMCLSVSATVIYMFVLFGAFLEASGCSSFINNFAVACTGHIKSGPALSAIVASALMGTINGSAVANVVGTGTFTIPLMKSRGYQSDFAAGVESVASTGGQILPPVMGAGAFIMVAFTNISYLRIAAAAVIPAVLYFLGCGVAVIFKAEMSDIKRTPANEIPNAKKVFIDGLIYLIIIAILITCLMVLGYSPLKSALLATFSVPVIMFFDKKKRYPIKQIPTSLKTASFNAVSIVIGCACAGIIVAVVAMTGIGVVFGDMMISMSGGNTFLALLFSAIACVILGMGLPTTASYVIAASIIAPALVRLNIPVLAAHLFVFYFACLSAITPPVALAAYAGAGIARSSPMKTAIEACKIGFAGFIVPFMFVYNAAILMEGSPITILYTAATAIVGVIFMSAGFQGFFIMKLNWAERIILLAGGLLTVVPETFTDMVGFVVIIAFIAVKSIQKKQAANIEG